MPSYPMRGRHADTRGYRAWQSAATDGQAESRCNALRSPERTLEVGTLSGIDLKSKIRPDGSSVACCSKLDHGDADFVVKRDHLAEMIGCQSASLKSLTFVTCIVEDEKPNVLRDLGRRDVAYAAKELEPMDGPAANIPVPATVRPTFICIKI